MNFLSVVAIFKNESHILNEWISHHIREGVDHFYLIDNGSTDNYSQGIAPYLREEKITLIHDDEKWAQEKLYNKYILPRRKESTWFMIIDLDEFVFARNTSTTIADFLKKTSPFIGMIRIPWKMFGSNGHQTQPEKVLPAFTKREAYGIQKKQLNKVIVKGRALTHIGIHYSGIKYWFLVMSPLRKILRKKDQNYSLIDESSLSKSELHLNHYAIQSWEWFKEVKCKRGSADTELHQNVRDEEYFKRYDAFSSDVEDNELSKKLLETQ